MASFAQNKGHVMVGGGLDLLKTDFMGFGIKSQIGIEANYFITNHISFTGGAEIWPETIGTSLVGGARFYLINPVFFRTRALIRQDTDVSVGLGYSNAISPNWRLEFMGDYFIDQVEFATRIGIAFILK